MPEQRAHVIVIANQKGGCGKTTTAVNLAAGFAREGHRTCLVDLDSPQLGLDESPKGGLQEPLFFVQEIIHVSLSAIGGTIAKTRSIGDFHR